MQLQQLLYSVLLLIPGVNGAFSSYDLIHTSLTGLYAYSNPDQPILTNVVFWGSFIPSVATTLKKGTAVCRQCEASKEEPTWDCADSIVNLGESVVLNAISLYIGWQHAGTTNGALEGTDTTVVKDTMRGNVKKTIFTVRIVLLLAFLIISPVILLMGGIRCHIMGGIRCHIMGSGREILNYLTDI